MIRSIRTTKLGAFTLIELLIVILLIGILMAFALPRFLGNRDSAGDRVAQQTLSAAVSATAGPFSENENYTGLNAAALQALEPNIDFVDGATTANGSDENRQVAVTTNGTALMLTARGSQVTCWHVRLDARGATTYGKSTAVAGACTNPAIATVLPATSFGGVTG